MSLVDSIPNTIKEVGRIKGKGLGASGDYGRLIADLGQLAGSIPERNRRREEQEQVRAARDQQLQIQQQQMAANARKLAADEALNNALSNSLDPVTGDVDIAKLGTGLRGTPGMAQFPDLVDAFTVMKSHAATLRGQDVKNESDKADFMGAMANGAAAFEDPSDQAASLLAGIASATKQGILGQDESKAIVEEITQGDGLPDTAGTARVIDRLKKSSLAQRDMDNETAVANATVQAQMATRQAALDKSLEDNATRRRQNYMSQLAMARTKVGYETVWNTVPKDLQALVDSPSEWNMKTSPERARFAGMSAKEQQDAIETAATAANTRYASETARQREQRLASGDDPDEDPKTKVERTRYKEFVDRYDKVQTEARLRVPTTTNRYGERIEGDSPAYIPPPSFEEWQAMPQATRSAVMADPKAPRTPPAPARMQSPAGADRGTTPAAPSAPAASKTISMADIEKSVAVLKARGVQTTVEEARRTYEANGYTIR